MSKRIYCPSSGHVLVNDRCVPCDTSKRRAQRLRRKVRDWRRSAALTPSEVTLWVREDKKEMHVPNFLAGVEPDQPTLLDRAVGRLARWGNRW